MTIVTKLLTLLIWTGIAGLILLINRIARFYQMTTGVRTHYRLLLVPMALFIAGMGRYLLVESGFTGDILGDSLFFLGGLCLSLIGYFLLKLMTGGRN